MRWKWQLVTVNWQRYFSDYNCNIFCKWLMHSLDIFSNDFFTLVFQTFICWSIYFLKYVGRRALSYILLIMCCQLVSRTSPHDRSDDRDQGGKIKRRLFCMLRKHLYCNISDCKTIITMCNLWHTVKEISLPLLLHQKSIFSSPHFAFSPFSSCPSPSHSHLPY